MLPSRVDLLNTVQSFPPSTATGALWGVGTQRGAMLPGRGSKERDRVLRLYDTDENNTLWQGTRSGFSKKVASVEYSIDGPPDITQYFHDLLGKAHLGRGWQHFIKLCVRDYLTQSYGCVIEIAGYGEAWEPLPKDLPITGINHLDAGRCYFTGNPVYPVIYYSLWDGKLHKMHADRVYVLVDDPDPDERFFGIGTCALERAIAVAQREIRMAQYVETKLDDKPNPGVNVWTNIAEGQFDQKVARFLTDMQNDERPVFGRTLNLFSLDPSNKAEMTSVPFSNPPDKFDFTQYVSLDVDMLALAFGTDRQEIWQLTGGNIGSSGQSEVLAEKSRGKTFGDFLTSLERFLNWAILPDECEAKLSDNDERKAKAQAEIDNLYAGIASQLSSIPGVSPEMILKLMVDKSPTYKDAFTNEHGEIVLPIRDQYTQQQAVSLDSVTPAPEQQSAVAQTPPEKPAQLNSGQPSQVKAFDPSEPRDGDGKWTEGGGSSGGGEGSHSSGSNPNKRYVDMTDQDETLVSDSFSSTTITPTKEQLDSIVNYTDISTNARLNRALRRGEKLSSKDKRIAAQLDDAINHSEIAHDSLLYRGLRKGGVRHQQAIDDIKSGKLKAGSIIKDNGFVSTSADRNIAVNKFAEGGVIFKIRAPKGSKGMHVNAALDNSSSKRFNHEFRDEEEVVLPRGSNFKVGAIKAVSDPKHGKYYEITLDYATSGASKSIAYKQIPPDEPFDKFEFADYEIVSVEQKAFNGTSANFKMRFIDIVTLASEKRISPAEFDTLMLANLERAGRDAYIDGLKQGGVAQMDDTDEAELQRWVFDQIDFIDNLKTQVYGDGISVMEVPARADMWQNKSLSTMYDAGRVSADRNGMYIWKLGRTEKHCNDCLRLNGQVHRFKDWYSRDWLPQSDRLSCNGFNCDCKLEKTTEPARGRF